MPFKQVGDLSISDLAFLAWGKTTEEMFLAAAEATLSLMVENPDAIQENFFIDICLSEKSLEMLLFNYLQELIFYKDARQVLFKAKKPLIQRKKDVFFLKGRLEGEKINSKKHNLGADLKAVTLYNFKVVKKGNDWQATVVLDV